MKPLNVGLIEEFDTKVIKVSYADMRLKEISPESFIFMTNTKEDVIKPNINVIKLDNGSEKVTINYKGKITEYMLKHPDDIPKNSLNYYAPAKTNFTNIFYKKVEDEKEAIKKGKPFKLSEAQIKKLTEALMIIFKKDFIDQRRGIPFRNDIKIKFERTYPSKGKYFYVKLE